MTEIQNKIIYLIEESTNYRYPLRWADEKTTLGDFDGREFSIDVFRIPISEQLTFLKSIRIIREEIRKIIGSRCLFIFHSPEATEQYYSHLFSIMKGACLEYNEPIKLPLPDITGTECKPIFSNQPTGIFFDLKKVAA
ncbi:MAG TPA: hypothetical protein VII64_04915 [Thermodesulfobacteriota bacterium]